LIGKMNSIGLELDQLNSLFVAAKFTLVRQDFQRLNHLSQIHSEIRSRMFKYFELLRYPGNRLTRNKRIPQVYTRNILEHDLKTLTDSLEDFKVKLLAIRGNTRCAL
jgi:hypothetical protein